MLVVILMAITADPQTTGAKRMIGAKARQRYRSGKPTYSASRPCFLTKGVTCACDLASA